MADASQKTTRRGGLRLSVTLAGGKRRREDGPVCQFDLLMDADGNMFRVADVYAKAVKLLDEAGAELLIEMAGLEGLAVAEIPAVLSLYEWLVWKHRQCWVSTIRRFSVGLMGEWDLGGFQTEVFIPATRHAFWERGIRRETPEDKKEWQCLFLAREGLRFPSLKQRRRGFIAPVPPHWVRPVPASWNQFPEEVRPEALPADAAPDDETPSPNGRRSHERTLSP